MDAETKPVEQRRKIHHFNSRPHTKQEKRRGKKESKKRRREKKRRNTKHKNKREDEPIKVVSVRGQKNELPGILSRAGIILNNARKTISARRIDVESTAARNVLTLQDAKRKSKAPHSDRPPPKRKSTWKELNSTCFGKEKKFVGAGTFSKCYQTTYRGNQVVVREVKDLKNVCYEARVLDELGDHPSLPFLFGITSKACSLVMQFHGLGGNRPATFFRAGCDGSPSDAKTWKLLLIDLVDAV